MARYTVLRVNPEGRIKVERIIAKNRVEAQARSINSNDWIMAFTTKQAYKLTQKLAKISINLILPTLVVFMVFVGSAHAYTHQDKIKAILGEAEGESQQGKDAIACCILNRGNLKGVYGAKAVVIQNGIYYRKTNHGLRRIPKSAVMESERASERAYNDEYCGDLIHGATGWGSESDIQVFKHSTWWPSVYITAHIGNHYFYGIDG